MAESKGHMPLPNMVAIRFPRLEDHAPLPSLSDLFFHLFNLGMPLGSIDTLRLGLGLGLSVQGLG